MAALEKGIQHRRQQREADPLEDLNPRLAVPAIMIVALVFRLFLMQYRFAVAFDEVNYLKLGVSGYLNGLSDVLHTYWSPLLPALISFVCAFFSDYELAGRLVSVLAGVLLVVPVYFLGKYVYDKKVGLVAGAFVAIFPPLAFQSTQVLTEPVYMLFATLAVYFGLRMLHAYSTTFALAAGLTSALAYLAHPQGFGFFLLLVIWIIFASASKLFLIKPLRAGYLLISLLFGFLVVASPYLFYLKDVTGGWTLSAKATANWQMEAPNTDGGDPFRSLDASNKIVPIDQIFHQGSFIQATNGGSRPVREVHIGPFIFKYFKNLTNTLAQAIPQLFTTAPLMLLGLGLFGGGWRAQQGKMLVYLLSFVLFYWLVVIPAFHINERYFTPLLPVCAIWVAKGALNLQEWLSSNMALMKRAKSWRLSSKTLAGIIVLAAFLALTFLPEFGRVLARSPNNNDRWAEPVEQKRAGLWLRDNVEGPKIIMSRTHTVDFYAGSYDITKTATIPKSSLDRILEYAKYRNVNYLVVNERYRKSYPEIDFLLDSNLEVPGLRLIYEDDEPANLRTRIFEVIE